MAKANETLNEMQKKFCQEYVKCLNATKSAKKAGYSEKTANEQGARLLAKVSIQEYIQKLQEGIAKRNQISQDEIVQDLIEIKNRCMQNVPVMYFDKVEKEWKHEGLEYGEPLYKFDSQGATKALDLLSKITGAYEKDNTQKQTILNPIQKVYISEEKKKLTDAHIDSVINEQ